MILLVANSTLRRYYTTKYKKRKLYRIIIRTYKSCIRYSNECVMPKG